MEEGDELKKITSRVTSLLVQWSFNSISRTLLLLAVTYILIFPLLEYLHNMVKNFPYEEMPKLLLDFFNKLGLVYGAIIFAFGLIFILLFLFYGRLKGARIIKDRFDDPELSKWASPIGTSWTTGKCIDYLGKMLTVTNSSIPGILKGAYSWYDYTVTFSMYMDKNIADRNQNIGIVLRSENNYNGIMLQISKTKFRPHLLYNGTFILDIANEQSLPTILNSGDWIKVKIVVKGNNITLFLNEYKIDYKIPNQVLNVDNLLLNRGTINLKEIQKSNDSINDLIRQLIDIQEMPEGKAKEIALRTTKKIRDSIPSFTKVTLEYPKGTVGFRQWGPEKAHFRDFNITRIE